MKWHSVNIAQLCSTYGTDEHTGLVDYRCGILRQRFGENKLKEPAKPPFLRYVVLQLRNILNINMLFVFVLSLLLSVFGISHWVWAALLGAATLANILLSAMLDHHAEKPMKQFSELSSPDVRVIRSGITKQVAACELVPGDVFLFEMGDRIPADARIMQCTNLKCDESVLTGQSFPSEKCAEVLLDENTSLADRANMVHMGCEILTGSGSAIVTATGMHTELGKIIVVLQGCEATSVPINESFSRYGIVCSILTFFAFICMFVYALIYKKPLYELLGNYLLFAAAIIPKAILIAAAVTMYMGVKRLIDKKAVIKKAGNIEALGRISVICTEKTGTLTQNVMTVKQLWSGGKILSLNAQVPESAMALLKLAVLCCDASIEFREGTQRQLGNPTEAAIIDAAMRNGLKKQRLDEKFPRVADIPFTSERKLMTTVNIIDGVPVAIVKGAYDVLCEHCTKGILSKAEKAHSVMCSEALRVIAVAYKPLQAIPEHPLPDELENDLTFAGLIGMIDPPREDVRSVVHDCIKAGIKPVMITGDHIETACAVAKFLGILSDEKEAVTGEELSLFTDDQLLLAVEDLSVYARIGAADKARVVNAWQKKGYSVLVVGGGISDVPAIKAADIGSCMEESASEASKFASDMIITDSKFSTVFEAIREGRCISDNLLKVAKYLITSCTAHVIAIAASILLHLDGLITLPQVLLFNLVVCLMLSLALGAERAEPDTMQAFALERRFSLLTPAALAGYAIKGLAVAASAVIGYLVGSRLFITDLMEPSAAVGAAMAFNVLLLSQLALAHSCRSRRAINKIGFISNPYFNLATAGVVAIPLLIAISGTLSVLFSVSSLSIIHWVAVIAISAVTGLILEFFKIFGILYNMAERHSY